MRGINDRSTVFGSIAALLALVGVAGGCGGAPSSDGSTEDLSQAVTEDALLTAYNLFKAQFQTSTEDKSFHVGFGFHPMLTTSKITIDQTLNVPVNGVATINFETGIVTANIKGPAAGTQSAGQLFDLWFVKNKTGSVKPEAGDQWLKVGSSMAGTGNVQTITANIGKTPGVNFDTDLLVLTKKNTIDPTTNVVATGEITLFEKRFFRERAGKTLDTVTGTLSNTVETTDPLVRRGAQIFFNEKFAGNGRTCGTCHRAEDNLTIDAAFIATLPSNDPLFANLPDGLEDPTLVRQGLIRENIDGFEQPSQKFVMRGVPHTLAMSTSLGAILTARGENDAPGTGGQGGGNGFTPEAAPPDHKTGWSGDGAPGRGTLHEFAAGAVFQHFTLSPSRFVGSSFRIPTQAELDALEAFQLFTGRQKSISFANAALQFGDPAATAGRASVLSEGACVACHRDLVGENFKNFDANTGVEGLLANSPSRPKDGGFGIVNGGLGPQVPGSIAAGFGNGQFNPPPLIEAADTAPFFHNSTVTTIEDAVAFYRSNPFVASPGNGFAHPTITDDNIKTMGAFLRTVNALSNIAQVRKRCQHVQNVRSAGNTTIINLAIRDTQDAINVLTTPNLAGATQGSATNQALSALATVKQALQTAAVVPDDQRPFGYMTTPLAYLDVAKSKLLPGNPNNEF
jgi:cytochrome c peroxidase